VDLLGQSCPGARRHVPTSRVCRLLGKRRSSASLGKNRLMFSLAMKAHSFFPLVA